MTVFGIDNVMSGSSGTSSFIHLWKSSAFRCKN